MFADNARISHRQLFRQIVLGVIGIYTLVIPIFPEVFGRQGILCLLTVMAVYILFFIYFIRIKTVMQNPRRYMGKIFGSIFVFLYMSWLWFMGVYLLLTTARITDRFLIEGSVYWIVIILAGAATYLGSHQGLENGRSVLSCFGFYHGRNVMPWDFANEELLLGRAGEFDFTGLVKRELSDFLCVFALCIFTCSFRQCEKTGRNRKSNEGSVVSCNRDFNFVPFITAGKFWNRGI